MSRLLRRSIVGLVLFAISGCPDRASPDDGATRAERASPVCPSSKPDDGASCLGAESCRYDLQGCPACLEARCECAGGTWKCQLIADCVMPCPRPDLAFTPGREAGAPEAGR